MSGTTRTNREMLEEFGLLAEDDLAALLGISVKSLKNKPRDQLPDLVKVGRRRLYKESEVREWLGLPAKEPNRLLAPSHKGAPPVRRIAVEPTLADLRKIERDLDRLQDSDTARDARGRYLRFASFSISQAIAALEAATAA